LRKHRVFGRIPVKMDVAEQAVGTNIIKDAVGERCQKLFQDFLEE
jgi:DNA replication licensing factor MCM6